MAGLPTIGIDLGRCTIKLVAVRPGRRPSLLHAAAYPTPSGATDGGVIRNAPALAQALRTALHKAGIRKGRAVIGVGGRSAVVRYITLPPMPAEELRDAVKWEAERHLPLRVEEAVLDAQVLREVTEDGQPRMEVVMAAVLEREALLYHGIASDAGLDVAAIEVASLALTRTLPETAVPTVAVDIGPDNTEIVVAYNGLPLVCRTLPFGRDRLPREASPDLSLRREPERAGSEAAAGLGDLLNGLTQSVDYFQAQGRREKIERVVLTGEDVSSGNVEAMLAGELGIPVQMGDPLWRLDGGAIPPAARERSVTLAVAAGLALRKVE